MLLIGVSQSIEMVCGIPFSSMDTICDDTYIILKGPCSPDFSLLYASGVLRS